MCVLEVVKYFIEHFQLISFEMMTAQIGSLLSLYFGISFVSFINFVFKNKKFYFFSKFLMILACISCIVQMLTVLNEYFKFLVKTNIWFENQLSEKTALMPYFSISFDLNNYLRQSHKSQYWDSILYNHARERESLIKCKVTFINKTNYDNEKFSYFLIKNKIDMKPQIPLVNVTNINLGFDETFFENKSLLPYARLGFSKQSALFVSGQYLALIQLTIHKLLKAPYKTDCSDFKPQIYNHLISEHVQCIESCTKNLSLQSYGCIEQALLFQVEYKFDNYCPEAVVNESMHFKIKRICDLKCKVSCMDYWYEAKYLWVSDLLTQFNKSEINIIHDNKHSTVIFEAVPKITFLKLFYEIGSIVGLWFGISLTTLYSSFFSFLKFSIVKFLQIKKTNNN